MWNRKEDMNRTMTKSKRIKLLGILTALMLILCSCSAQEEESTPAATEEEVPEVQLTMEEVKAGSLLYAGKREEAVTVKADASGAPLKITSEILLSGIDAGTAAGTLYVQDNCKLENIKNKEGDEGWVTEDGKIFWEYKGQDISYEGTAAQECPFGVKVTYYLNDVETAPEQLAGASGKLSIRFDYTNTTGQNGDYVPAAAMTAVFLPEKVFSDVEVENGTILSLSSQSAAVGLAFPGLSEKLGLSGYEPTKDAEIPEYVEITANVKDFKLSFTATVFTTDLISDLKDEDLEDLRSIPDDMQELSDASKELVDGTKELADGVAELVDHSKEYFDGVHSLKKGVHKLKEGTGELKKNSSALNKGAAALENGLKQLKNGLAKVDVSGLAKLSETDFAAMAKGLSGVDLNALADQLEPVVGKAQADQLRALQKSLSGLGKAAGQLSELSKGAGQLSKSLKTLKKGVNELYKGSSKLTSGIKAYTKCVAGVDEGVGALEEGASELDKAGSKLADAFDELLDGVNELKDGFEEFDEEGIQELKKYAGKELTAILDNITSLRDSGREYTAFSADAVTEKTEGSVRFIIETAEIK